MTEDEKRTLALSIFEAEKQLLRNRSPLNYHTDTKLAASLARSERQRHVMDSLAQNGITWDQMKAAYDEAVEKGKRDMVQLNMGYFYAGMAIAFKEYLPASNEDDIFDFLHATAVRMGEEKSTEQVIRKAEQIVEIDLRSFDIPPRPVSKGNRKDRTAVERMKKSGITEKDLAYERELGYQHGRNSEFFHSACYAAVVLVLKEKYSWPPDRIEAFVERINDLRYEEISRIDILGRAHRETGIDVSEIT
jgi:hypothetical protein